MNTLFPASLLQRSRALSPLLATLAAALPTALAAQAPLTIDQISYGGGVVNIQFTDQRLATNPVLNHAVEFSRSIGAPTAWTNVSGAIFSSLPSGNLGRAVILPASTTNGFYRIVGTTFSTSGTTNDTDGDGLSNAFEAALGTNPNLFDSDGDGFSDGVEYTYGTNPNNPNSFPVLTTQPRAEFAEAMSSGTEGSGPHGVTVRFDKPYFGTLKFGVLTQSTARVSVDYLPFQTNVTVAGASVVIPITWIDDAVISPDRVLFLEIKTDAALPYARGGQTRHTILLGENDAWWSGVLADNYAQRNFQLKLVHVGGVTQATLAAGAGNDGLPMLPGETNVVRSSQSVGVVPVGTFPATVQFDTTAHFKITSPPMAAPTGGLFGPGTGLTRSLVLESLPATSGAPNGQEIRPERVVGLYTECLAFPGQAACATQTGTVVLIRQLPARPEVIQ